MNLSKLNIIIIHQIKQYQEYSFLIAIFMLALLLPNIAFSQDTIQQDTIKVDSTEAARLGLFNDENKHTFKVLFSGKPARAGLYSLIFPGAGQLYNKQYYSVPIVWGIVGYTGYLTYISNKKYCEINRVSACLRAGGECDYNNLGITRASQLEPYRKEAKYNAEKYWVIFTGVYLVQAIYAYIQRHLIDFDLDEDLTFKPVVTPVGIGMGLSLNLSSK